MIEARRNERDSYSPKYMQWFSIFVQNMPLKIDSNSFLNFPVIKILWSQSSQKVRYKTFHCPTHLYSQIFFKLALGSGPSDMSRDTHCATCHELVFIKLYLFSNTTCFYFNLRIILNKFGNIMGTPQVPT